MSFPDELLKVFNNYENFPILENVISNDYIDNIDPNKMKSSIMKGTDNYNRKFIAVKIFPRELYEKMLKQQYKNHESCLTLIALKRNYYLPPDIAKLIQEFLEFRVSDDDKCILNYDLFLQNQISVHTIFQRYTITGIQNSMIVHGENSARCIYKYRYNMFDIDTIILKSSGKWNDQYSRDPKSEFEKLLRDQHPKSMIFNEKIKKLISGKYL